MTGLKAVIFDLDDTLFAEHDYVLSGFRAVAKWTQRQFGVDAASTYSELTLLLEQGERGTTFNHWLANHGLPVADATVAQMVQAYRNHDPSIQADPEARELLETLRRDGVQIGLVSDGFLKVQQKKFAALNLADCFQAVVFSDQFGREHWKPSTVPFQAVLNQLEVLSGEAVYVGDNPMKDFVAPAQLGMKSIHLRRSGGVYSGVDPDQVQRADAKILRLSEVYDCLRSMYA